MFNSWRYIGCSFKRIFLSFIRFQNRRVKYKKEVIIEKSPKGNCEVKNSSNSSTSSSCKCLCIFNETKNVIQAKNDKHDCDEAIVCSSTGSHIMTNNGINSYGCDQRM